MTTANAHDNLKYVRDRLDRWGEWSRKAAGSRIGYYAQSSHLNDRTSAAHNDTLIQSPEVAETDRAVLQLMHAHPAMHEVINQEYYWLNSSAAASRRLKISEQTYKNRRLMAEYWLDSRLHSPVFMAG